jgi:hypothetical protein
MSGLIESTTHWAEGYPWPALPDGDEELEVDEDWVTVHDHLDEAERLLGGVAWTRGVVDSDCCARRRRANGASRRAAG